MFSVFYKRIGPMKLTVILLVAIAIGPAFVQGYTFDDVEVAFWGGEEAGDGVNEALLVVDWQIPQKKSLVLGYRWTGDVTGSDMLEELVISDRFYLEWHAKYPTVYGIGWDADGDGFSKTDSDDYYAEGWMNGSWRYYLSTDAEVWTYSGAGVGGRTLADGDWDGWSWAPGFQISQPDNLPLIVEPSTPGDSNGDGAIDDVDYENMLAQFGDAPGENNTDFNGDGVVNLADFVILRENFGVAGASAPIAEFGPTAPEPGTLAFLVLGGSALLARRRRGR
jgi:hypothetical protein